MDVESMIGGMPADALTALIGRGDELAALEGALERVRDGEPVTVVLGGEAGIGKTRLVEELSARAGAAGVRLLSGACVDVGDATLPYGPVMDALRAVPTGDFAVLPDRLRRALATLIPEAAPDNDEPFDGGQAGVFGAVQRLLEHLGADAPVLLVLEDLHWADGSTEALVRFLAAGLRGAQVALVVTYRTDELQRDHPVRRLVAEIGRGARVQNLVLAPLTAAETGAQLTALTGGAPPSDETQAAIHARSEGNPFYTEELLAASAGGVTAIPDTLRETLLTRLDRLDPVASRVAAQAAAIGRHVEHALLAAISDLNDLALDEALRACVAGHVLAIDHARHGYRFRHALLAEVAAGELLPGERQRLHERVADLLEARPPAAGLARAQQLAEIAHHRLLGHDRAAGLAAAVRAARAAEDVHAIAEARRHYDVALELWEAVEDAEAVAGVDLPFVLERAAECCWLGFGTQKMSVRLRQQAIATLDPDTAGPRRAAYLARLAVTSSNTGVTPALPLYEEALTLLGDKDGHIAAEVRARYANALMLVGRYDEAAGQAQLAVDVARSVGARRDEADALITLAVCRQAAGDAGAAIALLDRVRPFASQTADPRVVVRYYTNYSHILGAFGRYEEAAAIAVEGVAAHDQVGLGHEAQISVKANGGAALNALGRSGEARALMGDPPATLGHDNVCLHARFAEADALEGDLDAAAARLHIVLTRTELESQMLVPVTALAVDVALWRGDLDTAFARGALGEAAIIETKRSDAAPLLAGLIRAQADAVAAGARDRVEASAEADRLLARLRRIAGGAGAGELPETKHQLLMGIAERSRIADGQPDPAPWRDAVAGWQRLRRPYDVACAQRRLAETLAATRDDRDELTAVLLSAHATALELGATHLAGALERLARRARVALPGTGSTTPDDALADITRRERDVLGLIAGGATNRQIASTLFISEKTASVHVSNILRKLDVANRGEAAAVAFRAGITSA